MKLIDWQNANPEIWMDFGVSPKTQDCTNRTPTSSSFWSNSVRSPAWRDATMIVHPMLEWVWSDIWRFPEMGNTPNHPKFDHFTIETYWNPWFWGSQPYVMLCLRIGDVPTELQRTWGVLTMGNDVSEASRSHWKAQDNFVLSDMICWYMLICWFDVICCYFMSKQQMRCLLGTLQPAACSALFNMAEAINCHLPYMGVSWNGGTQKLIF